MIDSKLFDPVQRVQELVCAYAASQTKSIEFVYPSSVNSEGVLQLSTILVDIEEGRIVYNTSTARVEDEKCREKLLMDGSWTMALKLTRIDGTLKSAIVKVHNELLIDGYLYPSQSFGNREKLSNGHNTMDLTCVYPEAFVTTWTKFDIQAMAPKSGASAIRPFYQYVLDGMSDEIINGVNTLVINVSGPSNFLYNFTRVAKIRNTEDREATWSRNPEFVNPGVALMKYDPSRLITTTDDVSDSVISEMTNMLSDNTQIFMKENGTLYPFIFGQRVYAGDRMFVEPQSQIAILQLASLAEVKNAFSLLEEGKRSAVLNEIDHSTDLLNGIDALTELGVEFNGAGVIVPVEDSSFNTIRVSAEIFIQVDKMTRNRVLFSPFESITADRNHVLFSMKEGGVGVLGSVLPPGDHQLTSCFVLALVALVSSKIKSGCEVLNFMGVLTSMCNSNIVSTRGLRMQSDSWQLNGEFPYETTTPSIFGSSNICHINAMTRRMVTKEMCQVGELYIHGIETRPGSREEQVTWADGQTFDVPDHYTVVRKTDTGFVTFYDPLNIRKYGDYESVSDHVNGDNEDHLYSFDVEFTNMGQSTNKLAALVDLSRTIS